MNRSQLNWGLLSTARINKDVIPAIYASKRSRLLAVGSRSQDSAAQYAAEWHIPQPYGDYDSLLADPQVDVIYISLPNHLHAEWTVKALHAGKHVLCEKPLAQTMAEMEAIEAAAHETGRMVAEAFMYRHHPQTLKVKEMLDSGQLGRLQFVRGAFSYTLTRKENFRADPGRGGGSIWDIGCYPISYARMLAGFEPVEAFGWQVEGPTGIDESFIGQMRFPESVHAQFDCGFKAPPRAQMEVVGTEGALFVPSPYKPGHGEEITWRHGRHVEKVKMPGRELYSGEVEDMVDAILEGKAPRISLEDSRANLKAILALLESARTGMPQMV